MRALLPIVEGHSELQSVPLLLRRILHEAELYDVSVLYPHLRGEFAKMRRNFSRYLAIAGLEGAPIIWIMDCDDGCAAERAADLEHLLAKEHCEVPVRFAFVVKEFESLFLADAVATRATLGVPANVVFPNDPEVVRGAKEWLSQHMAPGASYKPIVHQPKVAAAIDLGILRGASRSYRHLEKNVCSLFG